MMSRTGLWCSCLAILWVGSAQGAWIPVVPQGTAQPATAEMVRVAPDAWEISLSLGGVEIETASDGDQEMSVVLLPGETAVGRDGEPELPAISRLIGLSHSGNPALEIVSAQWTEVEGTYAVPLVHESDEAAMLAEANAVRDDVGARLHDLDRIRQYLSTFMQHARIA